MRYLSTATTFLILPALLAVCAPRGHGAQRPPSALIELDGTGSRDPDGDVLTYHWKQVGGPRVKLSNAHSPKPYFRTKRPGRYLFSLTVSDGKAASKPAIVEVLVERENRIPEAIVPADVECTVGERVTIDGGGSRDMDGDRLRYCWSQVSGPPLYLDRRAGGKPILVCRPRTAGVYQLELVVSDGKASSRPARCRLLVKPRNQPPVARVRAPTCAVLQRPLREIEANLAGDRPIARIAPCPVASVGRIVALDGRNSFSPSGQPLHYYWKQVAGPFIRSFDRSDEAILKFKPTTPGTFVFQLVVADGKRDSAPVQCSVRIEDGDEPPVAAIEAPACAATGTLVKLDGSGSYDKEGARLGYEWRQVAGPRVTNYVINPDRGNATPGFIPSRPGVYTFELVVTDGRNRSQAARASIKVEPANHVPRTRVAGSLTVAPGEVAVLQVTGEDDDGEVLSYTWRQVAGTPLLQGEAHQQSLTVVPRRPGEYVFEVVASDGHSRSRPVLCKLKVRKEHEQAPSPASRTAPVSPTAQVALEAPEIPLANDRRTTGKTITRFFQRFTRPLRDDKGEEDRPRTPPDVATSAPGIPDWAQ